MYKGAEAEDNPPIITLCCYGGKKWYSCKRRWYEFHPYLGCFITCLPGGFLGFCCTSLFSLFIHSSCFSTPQLILISPCLSSCSLLSLPPLCFSFSYDFSSLSFSPQTGFCVLCLFGVFQFSSPGGHALITASAEVQKSASPDQYKNIVICELPIIVSIDTTDVDEGQKNLGCMAYPPIQLLYLKGLEFAHSITEDSNEKSRTRIVQNDLRKDEGVTCKEREVGKLNIRGTKTNASTQHPSITNHLSVIAPEELFLPIPPPSAQRKWLVITINTSEPWRWMISQAITLSLESASLIVTRCCPSPWRSSRDGAVRFKCLLIKKSKKFNDSQILYMIPPCWTLTYKTYRLPREKNKGKPGQRRRKNNNKNNKPDPCLFHSSIPPPPLPSQLSLEHLYPTNYSSSDPSSSIKESLYFSIYIYIYI
ncbi:hypothetical protein VP01_110g1 [Puccinia sorghi]|uniref:Uncharacterized protein n=1 Tax=Puccinia sorghi TaxID=27349 RepID=A0A0L6VSW8_9BASI|nr:hypothetical protein VP01_110g1 [Puccinia sorghi]